mgnify:CR=1 FL=1
MFNATVPEVDGNVIVVESVPANVILFCTANVFKLVIDSVPVDDDTVNPFMVVLLNVGIVTVYAPLNVKLPFIYHV